jgi:hypothetical protein
MLPIFLKNEGKLRNGWRILIFFLIFFSIFLILDFIRSFLPTGDLSIEVIISEFVFLSSVAISTLIMMRVFEKSRFIEIGLKIHSKTAYEIFIGLIIGFAMITVVVLPNAILGYYKYDFTLNQIFPEIFKAILLFLLVAFAEEILFRGYPFQRLIDGTNPLIATLIFSLLFSIAHLQNPNVNSIALINVFLAGVWLSSAYVKTRSLWLPISLHFSWNFFQGYLFSLPVSGINLFEAIFYVEITSKNLISGGEFGPEGSVLASIVLVVATIFILKNKRLSYE